MASQKETPEMGIGNLEPTGISEISAYYLNSIGGGYDGTYTEFMQYTQNAGDTGGPAGGGGAFWQQVWRRRPTPGFVP